VRVLIKMVDPIGIQQRRAPLDAMNFIPLREQELREVGPVLSGYTCDESFFQCHQAIRRGEVPVPLITCGGANFKTAPGLDRSAAGMNRLYNKSTDGARRSAVKARRSLKMFNLQDRR
jgi:hypothetical protein